MMEKPECYVPGRRYPEIYSGTPTFMGLPKLKGKDDIKNYDMIVMGVPWEGVCTWGGFSGCELAPKVIRNASIRYGGYLPEYDIDVFDHLTGADFGDVPVDTSDTETTFATVQARMQQILDGGAIPVTFGGSHAVSIPLIRAMAAKHNGNIGIIHLDAHMDNMESFGESKYARCSPLHRAYEIEGLNPQNIIHVGIRGPRNNPKGMAAARKHGATIMTSFEFKAIGIDAAVSKAIEIAHRNTEAVYITVCSDVLDVANNPGGPPDLCGLSTYELARFLYGVSCAGIAGFDFVEVYPPTDVNNVSSHVACWMPLYVLSGLLRHRGINGTK